LIKFSNLK